MASISVVSYDVVSDMATIDVVYGSMLHRLICSIDCIASMLYPIDLWCIYLSIDMTSINDRCGIDLCCIASVDAVSIDKAPIDTASMDTEEMDG